MIILYQMLFMIKLCIDIDLKKKHYRFLVRYDKKILRKKIKESFKALFI